MWSKLKQTLRPTKSMSRLELEFLLYMLISHCVDVICRFLSDLQELASDKFDQHIAAIEERAARRVELATKKAEAQQDLMKMSSAASALQSMSQRVEAIRNDLAEALEGQRSSRAELRARVQQQELDGRRAVATLTEQTENAVQTALATQEELAQQQLANNETAEQLERVRQRAQATEESLDDAQSKRAHASARLGAAVEEIGHMDQHLHNPQQQLVVAGKVRLNQCGVRSRFRSKLTRVTLHYRRRTFEVSTLKFWS